MESGERREESGEWREESGERKEERGEWREESGERIDWCDSLIYCKLERLILTSLLSPLSTLLSPLSSFY